MNRGSYVKLLLLSLATSITSFSSKARKAELSSNRYMAAAFVPATTVTAIVETVELSNCRYLQ